MDKDTKRTAPSVVNLVGDFDQVVEQLRGTLNGLQSRVLALTENLQVAAEVSTQVATILEPSELLPKLVETVNDRFRLYHTHVYLIDEAGDVLRLVAGAGEPGRVMLAKGHAIRMDAVRSLVARAAREGVAIIAGDVSQEIDYLPNPMLPETRSEMAIPMTVGQRVIGVLDVQSTELNRFTEVDRQVKTTLAEQVAVAIQNAEAFAQAKAFQQELETRTRDLQITAEISTQVANVLDLDSLLPQLVEIIRERFALHHVNIYLADKSRENLMLAAASGKAGEALLKRNYSVSLTNETNLAAYAAMQGEAVIVNDIEDAEAASTFVFDDLVKGTRSKMAVPMIIKGDIVGVLTVQHNTVDRFGETDIRVQTPLADQLAIAIQNATAFKEVQDVRAELLLSNQAIQASNSGVSIADMTQPDQPLMFINPAFERITGYTSEEVLGKNCRFLQADDRDQDALDIVRESIANEQSCTVELRNYRKDGSLFWNELSLSPLYDNDGNVTHYVGVQTDITSRKQAEQREFLAYEIGRQLNAETDMTRLLQLAVDELALTFDYYHAHIYRYDEDGARLVVAAGLGKAGATMVENAHSIGLGAQHSLVASAARTREPVVVMNVRDNPDYLPNSLIPDTRSEVAVPLYVGQTLYGVLDVQSKHIGEFDEGEVRLLTVISNQLAVALANAQHLEETYRRLAEIQVSNEVATIITKAETTSEMLENILAVVTNALGADNAVYTQLVEDGATWQGIAGAEIDPDFVRTVRNPYADFPHGVDAVEQRDVVAVDNAYEYENFPMAYVESMGIKSVAVMPVMARDGVHGVAFFNFNNAFHRFTEGEVRLLKGLAQQVSTGLASQEYADAIQRRESAFRALIDTAPEAIVVVDLETGLFVQASQSASRLYKLPLEEMYQTGPAQLAPEYQPNGLTSAEVVGVTIQEAIEKGEAAPVEWMIETATGEQIITEVRASLMPPDDNGKRNLRASITDISERKKAEADRLRVYSMSIDMIGSAGFDGYFKDLNPAWQRILGFTNAELMAEPFMSFVHPDDIESTTEAASGLAEGVAVINFTNRYQTKDGGWRWISWNSTPDYNKQMIYFVARDITEAREREELVRQRARNLEMVSEVSSQINTILDTEALVTKVASLAADAFGLYHIHIWLADEAQGTLSVVAGDGSAPCQHVSSRYTVMIDDDNETLVTAAARRRQSIVANNVLDNPDYAASAYLPDTRAQVAIPLVVGARLIGVLDIHSDEVDAFDQDTVLVQTTLAAQIAVALENARSFSEAQKRSRNLETISAIATEAANNLNLDEMLTDVVNLIQARFDYYHAHVYLLDEAGENLDLFAGAGAVGEEMRSRGHSIEMDREHSLVARAARTAMGVIINDVLEEPDHLPNPLLPDTRSEMAIPLVVNRKVIGVLDVQANVTGRFDDQDVTLQTILAGQVAVAVSNARRFEEEQRRRRLNEMMAQITGLLSLASEEEDIVSSLMPISSTYGAGLVALAYAGGENLRYRPDWFDTKHVQIDGQPVSLDVLSQTRATEADFPIMGQMMDDPDTVVYIEDVYVDMKDQETAREMMDALGQRAVVLVPLWFGGGWQGYITMAWNEPQTFDVDFRETMDAIQSRLASVVASRRNFLAEQRASEQNDRRARELETVAQVSAAASTILDVDSLLLSVVELTKSAFELYHVHVYLYDREEDMLRLKAGAGEAGAVMRKHGHSISGNHSSSIVAQAARSKEGIVVNDVFDSATFMPNALLPETRSEMALPMMVGNRLIGVLDVQSEQANHFTQADLSIKTTLAAQVAVAVENARAFEQSQELIDRERAAAERLREVDRLKSEFLASMSHELRTPLNSIIGYSEVMLDGGDGELNEEAMEDIDIIHTSGRHLLSIINDILDLAKIEANQMQLKRTPTEIVKVLSDVIKTNEVLIGDRPVSLKLETEVDELVLPVDELRIRQIMLNLFSNATKFTEEGSVTISLTMLDDMTAKIAVSDTGVGISEEGQQIVFDQFRQVDGSSTRKAGGTGLGLTITRYLVNMHGGEIHVESEEGVGSTFWFTLPLVVPEEDDTTGTPIAAQAF